MVVIIQKSNFGVLWIAKNLRQTKDIQIDHLPSLPIASCRFLHKHQCQDYHILDKVLNDRNHWTISMDPSDLLIWSGETFDVGVIWWENYYHINPAHSFGARHKISNLGQFCHLGCLPTSNQLSTLEIAQNKCL